MFSDHILGPYVNSYNIELTVKQMSKIIKMTIIMFDCILFSLSGYDFCLYICLI
jgi:hypothetical protein